MERTIDNTNNFIELQYLGDKIVARSGEVFVSRDKVFIYLCVFCKGQFLSNDEFTEHVSQHHLEDIEPSEVDISSVEFEETEYIEMDDSNDLSEKEDLKDVLSFNRSASLETDDGFSKEDVVNVVDGKTVYECGYCHKQFQTKYSIESHRSIHERTMEFKCPEELCSKVFRTKKFLSKHLVVHRKEKPYKCEFCPHRSNYKGNLREHVRRYHTLEKPYKCQYCEKAFVSGTEKQMHERSHTGEKPFVCELCGKDYKSSTTLNYHLYKHNGVKNYSCSICDKAFSSPSLLWEHSFTHAKGKMITCDICGQSCKHAKSLRQHMRLHESKKYVCKVCQKTFAQNSGLYFHMKSHQLDNTEKA